MTRAKKVSSWSWLGCGWEMLLKACRLWPFATNHFRQVNLSAAICRNVTFTERLWGCKVAASKCDSTQQGPSHRFGSPWFKQHSWAMKWAIKISAFYSVQPGLHQRSIWVLLLWCHLVQHATLSGYSLQKMGGMNNNITIRAKSDRRLIILKRFVAGAAG